MSDSPRWHLNGLPGTTGIVEVMLYADHVAAVAAAEQRGFDAGYQHQHEVVDLVLRSPGYEQGQRAAREAVAAMRPETDPDIAHVIVSDVLAAIDALLKEKP